MSLVDALLALYVFMSGALHAPEWSQEALGKLLPVAFNWPLFTVALALISAPIVTMCWQLGNPT